MGEKESEITEKGKDLLTRTGSSTTLAYVERTMERWLCPFTAPSTASENFTNTYYTPIRSPEIIEANDVHRVEKYSRRMQNEI